MLVDPVVGAGGRFFLVLVDVDLEALAIAAVLPVGDGVADTVEERPAAEIDPADKHAPEMANVAYVITSGTKEKWKKELHSSQQENKRAHGHADGQEENADLAVGE